MHNLTREAQSARICPVILRKAVIGWFLPVITAFLPSFFMRLCLFCMGASVPILHRVRLYLFALDEFESNLHRLRLYLTASGMYVSVLHWMHTIKKLHHSVLNRVA